jgi:predicted PurR-regulated permease PerM
VFATNDSTAIAVIFTIWSLVVNFADTFLKPIFLGRGVQVPMLVILIGAIGGMIGSGIIGLFIGPVVFAIGYRIFVAWVSQGQPSKESEETGG